LKKGFLLRFEPLTELELQIYRIFEKYVKKYNNLDLNTLLPLCFQELDRKYSQHEITASVNKLIQKRYFIQGSTLSIKEVAASRIRQRLLDFIRINPGAYNRQIRRELNIGSNEFNWHVGMLIKFDFIRKVKFKQSSGYFENRNFFNHEYDLFLIRNEKTSKILSFITRNRATVSQIAKATDLHYNTVHKHLQVLESQNLITKIQESDSFKIYYSANEDLLLKLRKIINGQIFLDYAKD